MDWARCSALKREHLCEKDGMTGEITTSKEGVDAFKK